MEKDDTRIYTFITYSKCSIQKYTNTTCIIFYSIQPPKSHISLTSNSQASSGFLLAAYARSWRTATWSRSSAARTSSNPFCNNCCCRPAEPWRGCCYGWTSGGTSAACGRRAPGRGCDRAGRWTCTRGPGRSSSWSACGSARHSTLSSHRPGRSRPRVSSDEVARAGSPV